MKHRYWLRHRIVLALLFWMCLALVYGQDTTLVVTDTSAPWGLDPSQLGSDQQTTSNLYEPLIFPDKTGVPQGVLATSWEVSEDGKQYKFVLREGVTFHTGNAFECKDAEYSIHRALVTVHEFNNSGHLALPVLGFSSWTDEAVAALSFSDITEAVYCEEEVLVINLKQGTVDFPVILGMVFMYDKTWALEQGEWSGTEEDWLDYRGLEYFAESAFEATSAGTGAYQIVSRDESRAVFKRFENYWGDQPFFENVILQPIDDYNASILALKNGDVDLMNTWLPFAFTGQLLDAPGVSSIPMVTGTVALLKFNKQIEPSSPAIGSGQLDGKGIPVNFFTDIHVRRGFAAAYNKQRLIDESATGKGTILNAPMAPFFGGDSADWSSIPYDLALAEAELKQAWDGQVWEKGFVFDVLIYGGLDATYDYSYLTGLKESLQALNPKFVMNIKEYDGEESIVLNSGIWVNDWIPEVMTATHLITKMHHSNRPTFNNIVEMGLTDDTLDDLLTQLNQEVDPAKYQDLLRQVNDRLTETVPSILMPDIEEYMWYRSDIQGVAENYNPHHMTFLLWKNLSRN